MSFADEFGLVRVVPGSRDESFAELFRDHGDAVYRLAWFMTGSSHVAEEITAEVFARVLPKWRRGGIVDPVLYLRRAVVNESRSRHRRKGHEQRAVTRQRVDSAAVDDVDRGSLGEPLLDALGQLPARQRIVVVLRFVEDLSEAEVARLTSSPVGTVKALASRGLSTLRTLLEDNYEF